jgi:hypothetical protein
MQSVNHIAIVIKTDRRDARRLTGELKLLFLDGIVNRQSRVGFIDYSD